MLIPALFRQSYASQIRRLTTESSSREVHVSNLPPPRLDYKFIAENEDYVSKNVEKRAAAGHIRVADIVRFYNERKTISTTLNHKLARHNTVSAAVHNATCSDVRNNAIAEARLLKEEIAQIGAELAKVEKSLQSSAVMLPNNTHPDVPVGSQVNAIILSTHGPDPLPATLSRDHVRVARALGMVDLEAGSVVTGSSWYFLVNEGALLELALINYATSVAMKHGFKPVITPDVIKQDISDRCGFLPRDPTDIGQTYRLTTKSDKDHPNLVLAATAEIPLAGFFANKVLEESQLPLKVVGLGKAFRPEAGARGADTRGLYRVHQFTKVELFAVGANTQSEDLMEDMRKVQIDILNGLKLPLRVLDMPTEELGASAYRKYDIEAWMPGRGDWGEVTSTTNCIDYQSRRLHIRYRRKAATLGLKPSVSPSEPHVITRSHNSDSVNERHPLPFAHTLNGTAAAIPRLIVALLENGVRLKDDKVMGLYLPDVLRPFWVGSIERSGCEIHWV